MSEVGPRVNPFPGLRPFRPDETHLFFGRDEPTDDLIGRLAKTRFLAVVGVSGSGKSSLVKCGVLPALHGGFLAEAGSNWRVAMFRPSNDPIGELARGLASTGLFDTGGPGTDLLPPDRIIETVLRRGGLGVVEAVRQARMERGERLLIVADQFEELFRFQSPAEAGRGKEDKAAFVKLLLEAGRSDVPVYVMLTMRSDFLGECAQFRDLPEAINEGLYLIPRMTRDQLRETIAGPVAVAEGEIASRLINRLLNAVGEDPAQLPILQHALMRTWDAWEASGDPGAIDLPHYQAAGEMEGALDQHLAGILGELTADQRRVAKRLFQRLVEVTPEGKKIRREATVDQLCTFAEAGSGEMEAVIETFRGEGRTFLMPPADRSLDGSTPIDLSHESLIHRWGHLREWVEEDIESARIYRPLSDAAESWKTEGRSPYQDPELQRALDWWESWGHEEAARAWAEPLDERSRRPEGFLHAREFLVWSERQRARRKRRRAGAIATGFAVLLAWALVSTATARFEARAQLIELAATRPDPLEGALILIELQREDALIWRLVSRLWRPLGRERDRMVGRGAEVALDLAQRAIPEAVPPAHPAPVRRLFFDSSGERVVALFDDDRAGLIDDSTGALLELPVAIASAQGRIKNLVFADDSTYAFYDENSMLRTAGGDPIHIPRGRDHSAFSPDGTRFLALFARPGVVCVWRLDPAARSPSFAASASENEGEACRALIARDSTDEAAPSIERPAPPGLELPHPGVVMAHFSSDGDWLATRSVSREEGIRVWNLDTGDQVGLVANDGVQDVAVSAGSGGPLLATAHRDRVARVWAFQGDSAVLRCELGHQGGVESISFDRDGTSVLTASKDGTARLWDVGMSACSPEADSTRRPWQRHVLAGHDGGLDRAWFGANPSRVVTLSSADSTVRLWDVEAGEEPRVVQVLRGSLARVVALSPDGSLIATGGARGDVRIYRTAGTRWFTELADAEDVWSVAVAPEGSRIATAHADSTIRFWDRAGTPLGTTSTLDGTAGPLAFAPDGRLVAAVGTTTVVFNAGSVVPGRTLSHRAAVESLGFDETGSHVLAGLGDGRVEVWDARRAASVDSIGATGGRGITAVAQNRLGVTATGDGSGNLRIMDPALPSTELVEPLIARIEAVAFSPGGSRLAVAISDSVLVWSLVDTATAWRETTLGPTQTLPAAVGLHFLSDSTLLIAAGDGSVRAWHATRQDPPLFGFDAGAGLEEMSVAADGSVIATYHEDGTVRVWPREWKGLLYNLRERATRACLDADQRRTWLGEGSREAETRETACRSRYQTKREGER